MVYTQTSASPIRVARTLDQLHCLEMECSSMESAPFSSRPPKAQDRQIVSPQIEVSLRSRIIGASPKLSRVKASAIRIDSRLKATSSPGQLSAELPPHLPRLQVAGVKRFGVLRKPVEQAETLENLRDSRREVVS